MIVAELNFIQIINRIAVNYYLWIVFYFVIQKDHVIKLIRVYFFVIAIAINAIAKKWHESATLWISTNEQNKAASPC